MSIFERLFITLDYPVVDGFSHNMYLVVHGGYNLHHKKFEKNILFGFEKVTFLVNNLSWN